MPWLFGWNDFDDKSVEKAFDVALHLGTLIAAIVYLRHEVARYLRAGARRDRAPRTPARHRRPDRLAAACWRPCRRRPSAPCSRTRSTNTWARRRSSPSRSIVFAILLGLADRLPARRDLEDLRTRDALVVGAAQALSLNPGTSRSGITITGGAVRAASTATPPLGSAS